MAIKQLSAFVENKPGKLSHMIKALSEADINLRAMSIADTKDFGILRLMIFMVLLKQAVPEFRLNALSRQVCI